MHLLGLDVGTTGCKAVVFDEDGKVLGEGFREYTIEMDQTGKAEQDPILVWGLVKEVIAQAVSRTDNPKDIGAMSLSVQGDAIIPVDKNFNPVHNAILGMDYRSLPQAEKCTSEFGDRALFNLTGMRPHPMNSLTKLLFFRDRYPESFKKTERVTTYADFILGKLGAPPVIDYTMASRTMAFELDKKVWSSYILDKSGIDRNLFSKAVPSGSAVGNMNKRVAEELGLSDKTVLVTGGHDQPCNALGSGITKPGQGIVTTGTAEVFATVFSKVNTSDPLYNGYYPCYIGLLPDQYFTFSLNHTGGLLLQWFRDNFCGVDQIEAEKEGIGIFKYLDSKMPQAPTELLILPHFNGSGTPWSDMKSRGAIAGMTLSTTRYDILRAFLESLTYELSINVDMLESAGIEVDTVTAAGGGARSPQWLQIKADILNRPIQTTKVNEAGCLGAAVIAGKGVGVFSSFAEGVERTVKIKETYYPDTEAAALYAEKQKTYRKLYPALKPVNDEL